MTRLEAKPITALDIPTVRRAMSNALPLDVTTALTTGIAGLEDAMLFAVPMTDLGAPTLLLRGANGGMVGQFQHRKGETAARLTLLAPEPDENQTAEWTRLLEAMAVEAGKRGAHALTAELPEDHPVFIAFRMAGFVVYSRQVILRHGPRPLRRNLPTLLRREHERDAIAINTLFSNTVPRLLQQAEPWRGPDGNGLIYEDDGEIAGYLAITEGKSGVMVKPFFHPEVYEEAASVILSALAYIPRADSVPVYINARAYQDWLRGALEHVEFEPWTQQALMVKYTIIRNEREALAPVPALEASRLRPPVADGSTHYHTLTRTNTNKPSGC